MNTSIKFRDEAAKAAMAIPELRVALEDWHGGEEKDGVTEDAFGTWLWNLIDGLAANFKDGIEPTTEWMVNALKVQAGVIPSVKAVLERDKKSFELENADINSYIEEGMVNVSVWYKGKYAYAAAESTKDFFAANGWGVDVCKDEESDDEYTVHATKAFDGKEVK